MTRRPRSTTRRSTGSRCCAFPGAADFGGEGRIPKSITQTAWLNQMKNNGCVGCHQLGQRATRTIPEAFGKFPNGSAAWLRRVSSGQSGQQMTQQLLSLGPLGAQMLGDWTDRIAAGELPRTKPQRPQGIERNVVVTLEGIGDDKHYLHDVISTDKRKPTVNAYGPLYGSPEYSTDDPAATRSGEARGDNVPRERARPEHAAQPRSRPRCRSETHGAVGVLE
jgi:hypothetical protein